MKRCPECRRDYYDETLMYCLDDGKALLEGPRDVRSTLAPGDDTATQMLHRGVFPAGEPATVLLGAVEANQADISNAIAVLPFVNLSRNEDEYFSDGLAEEILNVLSKIRGLRVAARTSAFAFKGKQVSVKEIGRELDVSAVLAGSVRTQGERVRIAVQLVNAIDGYQLWSETYDRRMHDIFAIQDDIAESVAGELRPHLVANSADPGGGIGAEMARAVKGRATYPEAHRLMLLGRHLTGRANERDLIQASKYFHQALEIDPGYALCWCQLGQLYVVASSFAWELDRDYEKAEQALQRSLDLEPDLAEAHARLGRVKWLRNGDLRAQMRSTERALELAPESPDVLSVAAQNARELGQFEKAMALNRQVATVDPLNPVAWGAIAKTGFVAGDLTVSESAGRRALALASQRVHIHAFLGLVLLAMGRVDEALAEVLLEPSGVWLPWAASIVYYAAGRKNDSDRELEHLREFKASAVFQLAEVHSMRGETDMAFAALERSITARDPGRSTAKASPLLKPLHGDPRWLPLLKKIGFP
jgi:TolB-like protein/tetratricopeptide (TPR) repeat protein